MAVHAFERREALTPSLDERRRPAQEERHIGADMRRCDVAVGIRKGDTPRIERPFQRRCRIAAPAAEPRSHGEELLEPG